LLGQEYEELEATIGVEFGFIDANDIDKDDPNVKLSVQVWDTCKIIILKFSWGREVQSYNNQVN